METFYDKSDSLLKVAVYGSNFCKYLLSKSSRFGEAATERIEQFNDLSYRVRSCFGLLGLLLDWRTLRSCPNFVCRSSTGLQIRWKVALEAGVVSSGIASNSMDFVATILWAFGHSKVPPWLRVLQSRVESVRETTEWLANVFWAVMSTLSLGLALYRMHCAMKLQLQASKPSTKKDSCEEDEEEESVADAGTEALESALDLVAGGSGALGFESDATGLGPTITGCVRLLRR